MTFKPNSSTPHFHSKEQTSPLFLIFVYSTKVKVKVKSLSRVQLFATPWTVAYQALRSLSVHGIFQARALEWVAISFSRESSRPRDQTQVSCIAGEFFTAEASGKPCFLKITNQEKSGEATLLCGEIETHSKRRPSRGGPACP